MRSSITCVAIGAESEKVVEESGEKVRGWFFLGGFLRSGVRGGLNGRMGRGP